MKKLIYAFLISFAFFVTQSWGQSNEENTEYLGKIIDSSNVKNDSIKLVDTNLVSNKNEIKKNQETLENVNNFLNEEIKTGLFRKYLKDAIYSVEVPFGLSAAFGVDEHIGDKVEYVEYWNPKTNYDDYNFKYTPLTLDMAPKVLWSGTGYINYGNYIFGIKYFSFNKTSSLGGKIITPPYMVTKDETEVYYYNWLRYWNRNMWPLWNDNEPGGASPIWYSADNQLKLWSLDIFTKQKVYANNKNSLSFSYGIKFLKPYYELNLGMVQHADVNNYYGWHFDNWVTINSSYKSKFQGLWEKLDAFIGPSLGISYTKTIGNLEITPAINQAWVFGYETEDGQFWDVDDIHFYKNGIVIPLYYDGYAFFSKKQFLTIPVTESALKLSYAVNDYFDVGTLIDYYLYWNFPLGPRWDNPWAQGPWLTKVENVGVGSAGIFLKVNF